MKSLSLGIVMLFVLSLPSIGTVAPVRAEESVWSKLSHPIPRGRSFRVPSPDRKKSVLIEERTLIVLDGGMPVPGIEGYTMLLPAEMLWAPDSKAFVITANEGGIGEEAWFVTVYLVESDRVDHHDVTSEAAVRFKEKAGCPNAGEPNFGAVKWIKESKNLLVVADWPRESSCPGPGAIRGYVIEVPSGKVLSEHEPKSLSERWGEYLGPRFSRRSLP